MLRKKFGYSVIGLIMVLALLVPLLTACDDDDDDEITTTPVSMTTTEEPTTTTTAAEPTTTTAEPTPAEPTGELLTIDSKLGQLMENPDTKAILEKYLPDTIMNSPNLMTLGAGMTLGQIAPAAGGLITDEMLAAITADLEELGAYAAPAEPTGELLTIDSKLGPLMENPDTKAILGKYLPDTIMNSPNLMTLGAGMTLGEIAPMAGGLITDEMLAAIASELEELGAYAAPAATTSAPTETTSQLTGEPVKIGVVTAWTGPSAMVGILIDWWEAVVKQQVEDMGGILDGRPVEFVNIDDESTVAGVTAGVAKMALDEDVAVIAMSGTANAMMLVGSQACEKYRILNITPGTYDVSSFEYTISSTSPTSGVDDEIINFVIDVLDPDTVAWLVDQSEEDQTVRIPRMKDAFEDAGIDTLEVIAVPLGTMDFSPYVTRVKHLNPDVLILSNNASPEGLARQVGELGGWGDITVMGMTAGIATINTSLTPEAVGWYSYSYYVPVMAEKFPAAKEMEAAWSRVHPDTPLMAASVFIYNHFWAAIKAIEMAGTTDREDVVQAATSGELKFDTPYGHWKTSPDGTNTLTGPIVKLLEDGMFEIMVMPE